jgi:chromosome segregation ATPase
LESSQGELQRKIKEVGEEKAKIFDYKYQTDKLIKTKEEHEATILQLRKAIDSRETELATANTSFKNRLAEAYSKTKEVESSLQEQQRELSRANDSLSKKDGDKLSKIEEMVFAKKKNGLMERELLEKRQRVKELLEERERTGIEMEKLKRRIQSKEFTLNQKREEIDGEILTLRMAVARYKRAIEDKAQHVHPLLYEDQRSLVI